MFGPYRQVLRQPGAVRFSAAGAVARFQMAMTTIGEVLLISSVRDSYGLAGTVSAVYAAATALLAPQVSRQIDIRGQRRVVPLQLAVHVPAVAGLISVAVWTPLNWPIFVLAALAGASQPAVGPLVRARWSALMAGSPHLRVAFAWESLLDETVWIIGPSIATVLALQLFPSASLMVSTGLMVVGVTLLLVQRRTEPKPSRVPARQHGRPAIMLPGIAGLFAIFVLLGGVFGALEVATIAFVDERGHPGAVGAVFAAYSVASMLAGLVYGALSPKMPLVRQFLWGVAALAVVSVPLPFLGNVVLAGVGMALCGVACSPLGIAAMAIVDSIVPRHRLTEAMSWTNSGMSFGVALATPFTGWVIDAVGSQAAYWVATGCGLGTALVGLLVRPVLLRAHANAGQARDGKPFGVAEGTPSPV